MSDLPSLTSLPVTAAHRQRLRAVRPDEARPAPDFLPPGATWLPAPGHVLPAAPGGAPMVGYLVLVPAEPGAAAAAPPAAVQEPAAGGVRIDEDRRTAAVDDRQLDLTYLEFELLAHLVAHPHRVHSRDQLVTTVWGYGHVGDGRTVDVHIARLRRKLGADHRGSIVTVRRVGYKYAPAPGDRVRQGATARR
ncbi:winged helix-turn-helix domain-containing protein [Actinacidiphila bryophytorum]|uniref:Transcriptional regulatory protein, C terminal n=1 Tax=Actinacidiphila bryophytorum TaxID=1436133 RepID=A0A9W4H8T3_9ACTN|nr:winged helix-turn-helix domain-containing protein [Actinacidiphila bryophytorum]MBM9440224.1 winged helix-turn-helix transcriptional regulator [Actinacidiphila bryophytorum]MBN6546521.1 winged helix-turn-helix transcriptional regulator [Actinacidiphila bryophytorum]CAG7658360.1 Transcriptional regulatory protein, C terminal [Actinacidiphila bryophytorum]